MNRDICTTCFDAALAIADWMLASEKWNTSALLQLAKQIFSKYPVCGLPAGDAHGNVWPEITGDLSVVLATPEEIAAAVKGGRP